MKNSKRDILKVLLPLSAIEGIIALIGFLSVPSDDKSSFLFGLSLERLSTGLLAGAVIILFTLVFIKGLTNPAFLDSLTTKIQSALKNKAVFGITSIILWMAVLVSAWLLILYTDPLDSSSTRMLYILNRLFPLVAWAFLLSVQFFWFTGYSASPGKTSLQFQAQDQPGLISLPSTRWVRAARTALIGASVLFMGLLLYVTLARIGYPYELEWMESGSLVQAVRILNGQPVYSEPTIQYLPFIYTSLYFYLSVPLIELFGMNFLGMRILSFTAAAGCALLIYLLVKRRTQRTLPAILSVGIFCATFPLSGAWFDIARVDSLFLFFLVLAGWWIYRGKDTSLVLAGTSLALAYFTKQTALISIILLVGFLLVSRPRKVYLVLTPLIFILTVGIFFENLVTQGWYKFYTIELPATHWVASNYIYHLFIEYLNKDLFSHIPIVLIVLMTGIFLFFNRQIKTGKWMALSNYTLEVLAVGFLILAWGSRLNAGNYINVLMPAFAGIALLTGLYLDEIEKYLANRERLSWMGWVYLVILFQFGLLLYNPSDHIPTRQDRDAGDRLVQSIASFDGEVFIPFHNAYAFYAGKQAYAHKVALDEIFGNFGTGVPEFARKLDEELNVAFEEHLFDAIYLDEGKMNVEPYYECREYDWPAEDVFYPVTGAPVRPQWLCIPSN